ncbi:MAG: threonine/serine dehydratase [Planctomycetota bacterium]|nr:MAG: threonine/serine dehydratase [Planctomycetota bacterium]
MLAPNEVEEAARRLAGKVRRTPLLAVGPAHDPLPGEVLLKLECLQVTGSFKARGALNKVLSLPPSVRERGLVTASGGNHGLGVAYAGRVLGAPARVYLPESAPPEKAARLRAWGAEVVTRGAVWDDANAAALAAAADEGLSYVHPFADPAVIAGQGTVALEVLADAPSVDTFLVAVGGGGLASGVALAVRARGSQARVVGVEPAGAPTLSESLRAGAPIPLPALRTRAGSLAPRRTEALNLALIQAHVEQIVLVDDGALGDAARWLWKECGLGVELGGAAAVAALRAGAYVPAPGERVCAVVCGAGSDGLASAPS